MALEQWAARHPRAVYMVTWGLIGWALADLVAMVELHVRVGQVVAEVQRASSESLGG